jgi:U4/U6.U5 tri-snRNP-associated protein 1
LARKKKELEDADKAVYGESKCQAGTIIPEKTDIVGDLAGLKVGHGAEDFETGEDVILTLKDSKVLGEDGKSFLTYHRTDLTNVEDELQNVNIAENEAVKAAKERKRKAQAQYTGLDDEEFDEDRIGKKADVLGKYDDGFSTGKMKTEVCLPFSAKRYRPLT